MGDVGAAVYSGALVAWFGVQGDAAEGSEEWLLEQWIEKKIQGVSTRQGTTS